MLDLFCALLTGLTAMALAQFGVILESKDTKAPPRAVQRTVGDRPATAKSTSFVTVKPQAPGDRTKQAEQKGA